MNWAMQERDTHLQASEQYLTFSLGGELFAVGTRNVREIIEYGAPRHVPMMPPSILGVINLRGSVVPVIDLLRRFGKGATEAGKRSCIIILEARQGSQEQVIGVVVDTVSAVLEIPHADIEPPPHFGQSVNADFLLGMGKLDSGLVLLLDVGRVLSQAELQQLSRAVGEAEAPCNSSS